MLKKWFLVLLLLAALFAFGACKKEDPTPPPANGPTAPKPPSSGTAQPVLEHSGTLQDGAITWEIYSDGKMVVKGSGAIPDFESIELDQPWWLYGDTKVYGDRNTNEDPIALVTSIVIEEGITSLGKNAFADQDSVTTVTLPNTLTTLGEACFKDCQKLSTAEETYRKEGRSPTCNTVSDKKSNNRPYNTDKA